MTTTNEYVFRRKDTNEIVVLEMSFDELLDRMDVTRTITLDDGTEAVRDVLLEEGLKEEVKKQKNSSGRVGNLSYNRPLASIASSVHPSQVARYRQFAQEKGFSGVEIRDDGTVMFHSRGDNGRRGWNRAFGRYDKDGGYGD